MTKAIVITTINKPTLAVERIAAMRPDWNFIVVGDNKTPLDWSHPGVRYLSVAEQKTLPGRFSQICPWNHYCRKNVGYLEAIRLGSEVIAETDDDNIPYDSFVADVSRSVTGSRVAKSGWENIYTHFVDTRIWPRGFPLELINDSLRERSPLEPTGPVDCLIQQFLADGDPDVDAVFRLTNDQPTTFGEGTIVLERGTYCPFNSQNTIFWPEVYPLLYLPSYVSFRMTDIWRSFVAQECLYRMGGHLAFRSATVRQVRNEHSYIRDFEDEISGYLANARIMDTLSKLDLSSERADVGNNLYACYEALVSIGVVPERELPLLRAWLDDLGEIAATR